MEPRLALELPIPTTNRREPNRRGESRKFTTLSLLSVRQLVPGWVLTIGFYAWHGSTSSVHWIALDGCIHSSKNKVNAEP